MDYYKRSEISNSDLNYLSLSINHFLNYKQNPKEPTPAMIFGSLVHCLALEPHNYSNEFCIAPKVDRRLKESKIEVLNENDFEIWKSLNLGKKYISQEQLEHANILVDVLKSNERYKQIQISDFEKEIYFTQYDVECRSKLDIIENSTHTIYDLKTIDNISDFGIRKSIRNRHYYRQAQFYLNAMNDLENKWHFVFIFIEKESPYSIRFVELSDMFKKGEFEIQECLEKYRLYQFNELDILGFSNEIEVFEV